MEKMTIDEYPSVNEYYNTLIESEDLFVSAVPEMDEQQLIEFYEFVIKKTNELEEKEENKNNPIWFIKSYIESLEVIQVFLSQHSSDTCLSKEEQKMIDDTIKLLEERRHISPLKRLIKYFKR